MTETNNIEKSWQVQEKEIDIHRKLIMINNKKRQNSNKRLTKLLDKFIDKKESEQDIFVYLKTELNIQQDILEEDVYQSHLENITENFMNSDSL